MPHFRSGIGLGSDIQIMAGGGGYTPSNLPVATARNSNLILKQEKNQISITLKGVSKLTLSYDIDSPEYTTDYGFKVSDHYSMSRPTFDVSCILTDEWENSNTLLTDRTELMNALTTLLNTRDPFTIECDFGTFDYVIFTDFQVTESSDSLNSFEVSFTLKKILMGIITAANVQFVYDSESNSLVSTSLETGELVNIQLTDFTPITDEQKSYLMRLNSEVLGGVLDPIL